MIALLTTVHVLVALVLVLVVLLQSARGTDLAGAFGGMGSQTAFGPRGTTTFLSKTTAVLAAVFMVTSLTLSIMSNRSRGTGGSVLSGEKPSANPKPATPSAPGQPGVTVTPTSPASGQPNVTVTPVEPPKASPTAGGAPTQTAPNVRVTPVPPPQPSTPAGGTPPGGSPPAAPAPPSNP